MYTRGKSDDLRAGEDLHGYSKLYTSNSDVIYDGPDTKTLDITSKYGKASI